MQVRVKIKEVLAWELPEITLEMCQALQPEVTSVEGFMKELREAVVVQAQDELQVCTASVLWSCRRCACSMLRTSMV